MNILVIDAGTTSIRAILYSGSGEQITFERERYSYITSGSEIELDPEVLTRAFISVCERIGSRYPVNAMSLTAFRSAPLLADHDGNALCNFIMWQDTRNRDICDALSDRSEEIRGICGSPVNTVFTGGKLTWFKRNRRELWEQTYKAMVVPDYLTWLVTGEFVTDHTYGSRTLLMNISSRKWDDRLCEIFDIETDKLCPLISPGSISGYTNRLFAELTGIPEGIPLVSAGGDQQCATLGSGVRVSEGIVCNCGTGAYITAMTDHPVLDRPDLICNCAAIPGKYIIEKSIPSCATRLNEHAGKYYPEANGNLRMLEEDAINGTDLRADLTRSLIRDLADEVAACIRTFPLFHAGSKICISGGVSESNAFCNALADKLDCSLLRWNDPESTAIGAFSSCASAIGLTGSAAEGVQLVRQHDRYEIIRSDNNNS